MDAAACPHCGYELDRIELVQVGDLTVADDARVIHWKGELLRLTIAESLIVSALARLPNHAFSGAALAGAAGYEGDNTGNMIAVWMHRIRQAFQAIDPGFDRIETARCRGYFWRTDELRGEHHGHR